MSSQPAVGAAGTIDLGGDLTVNRMGFGAMRITGRGIWGDPPSRETAIATLRRVVELGVSFIDTADAYGPEVSEELIAEALHPYPDDLVIATKGGQLRPGPNRWEPDGRPGHVRQACEGSLRRLPWAPIQQTDRKAAVAVAAERRGVTERQIVLAWLLASSAAMLPIPGTGSPEHAEGNIAAAGIELSGEEMEAISKGG